LKKIIGIDIGGTKCALTLGEGSFELGKESIHILEKVNFPTSQENGPERVLNRISLEANALLKKYNLKADDISSAGISCGGPLNGEKGLVLSPPNLPGWDSIPVVKIIQDKTGIKTYLQNDADACALAEWKFGAGQGCKNMIFLTFGTGLGAGMILNGRLYTGASNMAGEVGHIRIESWGPVGYGKSGALEGFCSGGGIAQLARMKVLEKLQRGEKVSFCESLDKLQEINAKIVGDAAEAGDELAKEIYAISGEYLGKGLSILIDILNPEKIIIGSIFARSRDLLWPAANRVIQKECLGLSTSACSVVPSGLGEKVGDCAALTVALHE
jgi:glucokinase